MKVNAGRTAYWAFLFSAVLFVILYLKWLTVTNWNGSILIVYSVIVLIWVMIRFWGGQFYRQPPANREYVPSVSVIVPAYNEEHFVEETVKKWLGQDYPKGAYEVIVVDDGSKDKTGEKLEKLVADSNELLKVFSYPENQGKRHAQKIGFEASRGDIVVIADSDSYPVDPESVRKIVQPFQDPKVGGVCGHTDVGNAVNWLTKLQKVKYWTAFSKYKSVEALTGGVICLSGCFSAIRKAALLPIMDEWYTQSFLGKRSFYGDDRNLTTLLLRSNWKTVYAPRAKAETFVPETFTKFWRQQVRWTKSYLRETYIEGKFIWKRPWIALMVYFGAFMTFSTFAVTIYTVYLLSFLFNSIPLTYIVGIFFISIMYAIDYRMNNKDNLWVFYPLWIVVYLGILVWKLPTAILTLKDNAWKTR
jgi:hyaluronan synthase